MAIGIEKHQGAKPGRADRIALGHRLRRIANRVERIGHVADILGQTRHFGDAAGIVGHRSESVERDDHAGKAEHGRHRDRRAEEAGELTGEDNAADDDERRQRGRFERDREALDDIGAMSGDRGLRDGDDRPLAGAGVIFGDDDDETGHHKPDEAAEEKMPAVDRRAAVRRANGPEADRKKVARASPTIDKSPAAIRPL